MKRTKRGKRTAGSYKKACDKLVSRIARRMTPYCQCCHASGSRAQLQVHHLISRKVLFHRWTFENLLVLCPSCHEYSVTCSPGAAPWGFLKWLRDCQPVRYQWLMENKNKLHIGWKPDYPAILEQLKEIDASQKGSGMKG